MIMTAMPAINAIPTSWRPRPGSSPTPASPSPSPAGSSRSDSLQPVDDDIEAIRRLKARYFRTMDTKHWDEMRQVFTDEVVVDTSESGGGVVTGADEFMAFLRETLGDVITVHHGHMPEIELRRRRRPPGSGPCRTSSIWPDGTRLHGYGHYHETYEKVDGTGGSRRRS